MQISQNEVENMDYQEYKNKVIDNHNKLSSIEIKNYKIDAMYEEKFG